MILLLRRRWMLFQKLLRKTPTRMYQDSKSINACYSSSMKKDRRGWQKRVGVSPIQFGNTVTYCQCSYSITSFRKGDTTFKVAQLFTIFAIKAGFFGSHFWWRGCVPRASARARNTIHRCEGGAPPAAH